MTKEKLEEIENRVISRTFHTGLEVDVITLPERDYAYLIEQARQNIDLAVAYDNALKDILMLKNENKQLKAKIKGITARCTGGNND